jgi:two-component sensor histidine kinase
VPTGRVAIGWQFLEPDRDMLRLTWRETGGPPVSPPQTSGFGRIVIERLIADQLGAAVTASFAPEGLRWQIDIPVGFVAAEPGEAARSAPASPPGEGPTQTAA